MRTANRRFEAFAKRLGMTVAKGKTFKDVDEVMYRRLKMFSIPSRMNAWPNSLHSWHGMMLPNLHDLEMKARVMWFRNKFSFYWTENIKEYANQKFNPHEYEIEKQG